MISEVGVVSKMLFDLLGLFGYKYVSNREKASSYVAEVLRYVKIIVEQEAFPSNQVDYAHEMVKKLYDGVSDSVGQLVANDDVAKIRQALSAARIYYWVRHYSGKPGEEILEIINERLRHIKRGETRHNSNEYIIMQLKEVDPKSPRLAEHKIELIKDNCLADIAELEELVLNVVVAKVRKW